MVRFPPGQDKADTPPSLAASKTTLAAPVPLGLYVHVPFCASTCDFCAFYQTVPKGDAIPRYLAAVEAEGKLVDWAAEPIAAGRRPGQRADVRGHSGEAGGGDPVPPSRRRVTTAFWGGGTPGLLRAGDLEQLGRVMLEFCSGAPEEWTVELAPATVTTERLAVLKALGVTRVSMGVQSFREDLLDALGRHHNPMQIYRAYELIRGAGFASVNLDLMFALPGQSEEQWRGDLDEAIRLAPDHLSTYCLTFEEDTALWVKLAQGKVKLDAEKEAMFYERTWDYLGAAGFAQYEISNFARPGHLCRHNQNTWRMHEWVGLGPSAASQHGGWRANNPPDLAQWHTDLAAGRRAQSERTRLTPELLAADSVAFGLRMNEGVSLPELQRRFPTPHWSGLFDLLPKFVFDGLLAHTPEGRIRLTPRGRLVADAVGAEVLGVFAGERVSSQPS
jgi:oxygen-independent coproporphyrinogen-3 oxidase